MMTKEEILDDAASYYFGLGAYDTLEKCKRHAESVLIWFLEDGEDFPELETIEDVEEFFFEIDVSNWGD